MSTTFHYSSTQNLILNKYPVVNTYLGQVATRCRVPQLTALASDSGNYFTRTYHYARDDITSLSLGYAAWWISGDDPEQGIGGPVVLKASIEYPANTFHICTWNGSNSVSVASLTTAFSDFVNVTIPNGSKFYSRMFISPSNLTPYVDLTDDDNGVIFTKVRDPAGGDISVFDDTDYTMTNSGSPVDDGGITYHTPPVALIAQTSKASFGCFGGSRMNGYGDTTCDSQGNLGGFERVFGPSFATLNLGVTGDTIKGYNSGHTQRSKLFGYCSHIYTDTGLNDLVNDGASVTQIEANIVSFYASANVVGKPIFQETLYQETTSTDNWATTTHQTKIDDADRITLNNWIKANTAGITGYVDSCNAVETSISPESGFWKANMTWDGVHANANGYANIASSGFAANAIASGNSYVFSSGPLDSKVVLGNY